VTVDATMMACRHASFVGMLLDRICRKFVSIFTNNYALTFLRYISPMRRYIFKLEGSLTLPFFGASCLF